MWPSAGETPINRPSRRDSAVPNCTIQDRAIQNGPVVEFIVPDFGLPDCASDDSTRQDGARQQSPGQNSASQNLTMVNRRGGVGSRWLWLRAVSWFWLVLHWPGLCGGLGGWGGGPVFAQPEPGRPAVGAGVLAEKEPPPADITRVGRWLVLPEVCDESAAARLSREILELQAEARKQGTRATLLLEVGPGQGTFAGLRQVARLLSQELSEIQTVAWIPRPVTGPRGLVALACREVALSDQAELGDLSSGQPLDPDQQAFLVNLATRGNNPLLSEALILGMLDRRRELVWVQFQGGDRQRVTRVLQRSELAGLQQRGVVIERVQTLKEPDSPGVLSAEKCRSFGVLARHFANSREQVQQAVGLKPPQMLTDAVSPADRRVLHLRLQGRLDRPQADFAERQLRRLSAEGLNLLLLEIDLAEGEVGVALALSASLADLSARGVRTVAWIPVAATGAAAVLPLGCDSVWMGPQAEWGDVQGGGPPQRRRGDPGEVHRWEVAISELARRRERPGALAAALVSNTEPVQAARAAGGRVSYFWPRELAAVGGEWQAGELVPECGTGKPLLLSALRAHELGLAEEPIADQQALATRLGVDRGERWLVARQDWVDRLVLTLNRPWVTGLLLAVALLMFYFEAHLPIGAFAIAGIVCFALFFWSRFLGGTAGWLEVILFGLGLVCLGVELLLIPGFGVFGISGIGLCLVSLIMAMQTTIIPHTVGDLRGLAEAVFVLGGACLGVLASAAVLGRYLPEMPWVSRLVLQPPGEREGGEGPRLRPDLTGGVSGRGERGREWLGRRGVSASILRPAGRADFDGEPVDVVSEGPFIPVGRPVVVIDLRGAQVVVREVKQPPEGLGRA